MPGLLVAVGDVPAERFRLAAQTLLHTPASKCSTARPSPDVAVAAIGSPDRVDWSSSTIAEHSVQVWRYGHTFKDDSAPRAVGAAEILSDYLARGVEGCCTYDGAFVIVIVDTRSQTLHVTPDRLCTLPVQYQRRGDDIVIAPEVKALGAAFGKTPTLSTDGVVGFLAAGYNIGEQTIFSEVRRLELGKRLEISLTRPRQVSAHRFWKLDFSSHDKLTQRDVAEGALHAAILQAHKVLLSDRPKFQILLSGGADSRGMLAACTRTGQSPARALSWGLVQEAPRSDAAISRALARQFGVPWEFITTRTQDFVDNCEQWAYVSELANDNFGWYTEGSGALRALQETGLPCTLIGDESWGWQGFARSAAQAHGKVLPATAPSILLSLLPDARRAAAAAAYEGAIAAVMRDCADEDWNDRKDFLYLHGRVARFIFSLGYYREHATELRRPFFVRAVLDVVQRAPAEFRVFKNLYRTTLKRYLPETVRAPYAAVNSLPDWDFDLRTDARLRGCFASLLHDPIIDSGVLSGLFDPRAYRRLRDDWFAQAPTPVARTIPPSKLLKAQLKESLWAHGSFKHVDRVLSLRRPSAVRPQVRPVDILRRVAILVLLERQLPRFAGAGLAPAANASAPLMAARP